MRRHRRTAGGGWLAVRFRRVVYVRAPRSKFQFGRACHIPSGTSTISFMEFRVDRSDPLPLHEQAAAAIRRAIAEGEAGPGDRLPLAKDLAAIMGVNKNTVIRSLHLLRDEGLLEFRRGHGITVAGTPEKSALLAQVRDLVRFARRHGYNKSELIAMIEAT